MLFSRDADQERDMAISEEKFNEFLGRFVTDLGATIAEGNDPPRWGHHRRTGRRASGVSVD
ncbi:MAG TPA: hypothetical protein VMF60_10750 [Acidimicrobiales bacterium]|nr:hypothetical protein [Acidimicrobiales bacterium]